MQRFPSLSEWVSGHKHFRGKKSGTFCVELLLNFYLPKWRGERARWCPLDSLSNLICDWETKIELSKTLARIDLFWNLENLYCPGGLLSYFGPRLHSLLIWDFFLAKKSKSVKIEFFDRLPPLTKRILVPNG